MLPILAIVAVAGFAFFMIRRRNDTSRAMIENDLKSHGATDVEITSKWVDYDRDTLTYDVAWTDPKGQRVRNRAKVPIHPFADRGIYWQEPLS